MMTVLISVWVAGAAVFLWMMRCNHKTFEQRKALIERIHEARIEQIKKGIFPSDYVMLDEVLPYGTHLRSLALFRDPSDILELHFQRMTA